MCQNMEDNTNYKFVNFVAPSSNLRRPICSNSADCLIVINVLLFVYRRCDFAPHNRKKERKILSLLIGHPPPPYPSSPHLCYIPVYTWKSKICRPSNTWPHAYLVSSKFFFKKNFATVATVKIWSACQVQKYFGPISTGKCVYVFKFQICSMRCNFLRRCIVCMKIWKNLF